jgi:hypothetical protein
MKFATIFIILFISFYQNIFSVEILPYSEFGKQKELSEAKLFAKNDIKQKNTYRSDPRPDKDGNIDKWLISREYFDENGKLLKFESISDNNNVVVYSEFKYNEEGLISKIIEKDAFHTLIQNQTFTYDAFSRIAKIVAIGFNDALLQTTLYEYNEEKGIAIETVKDSLNSVNNYSVYLYDKPFNRIIKSTLYNKENQIDGTKVIHYNDYGINSREIYQKDIDQPFTMKYQNIFNEKKLLSEVQNITYPNNLVVSVFNEYNDDELIISTNMFDKSKNPITTISFEYVTE